MPCPNCGAELLPNAKFCSKCGVAVGEPEGRRSRRPQNRLVDAMSGVERLLRPALPPSAQLWSQRGGV
jgi:hypothetical protein